jgi:hypothetical protein
MNFTFTLFVALLFVVLSPGVLLSLPSKGSLLTKVLVHSVVFAVVFYLTAPMVLHLSASVEGFRKPSPTANHRMQQGVLGPPAPAIVFDKNAFRRVPPQMMYGFPI